MFLKSKKFWLIFTGIVLTLVVALEILWFWAASGPLTGLKKSFFSYFPVPVAKVDGRIISSRQFLARYNLLSDYLKTSSAGDNGISSLALNQLIKDEQTKIVAERYKLLPTKQQVETEYLWQKATFERAEKKNFEQALMEKGFTPEKYKNQAVENAALDNNLKIWFNGQKDLNPDAYSKADEVLKRAGQGENFADLAGTFSQDQQSKMFFGDLGFQTETLILPELAEQLKNVGEGQIRVVPTRSGLEIIKLENVGVDAQNQRELHLKHIFITCADFNAWLKAQTQTIAIKQFIKF